MREVTLHRSATPLSASLDFHSATANAWGRSILAELASALNDLPDANATTQKIAKAAQALFDQHPYSTQTRAAGTAAGVCALMLESYRILGARLDDRHRAQDITQSCFAAGYRAYVAHVCVPLYRQGSRAPDLMQLNFAQWSRQLYPDLSGHEHGYGRFFSEHGANELTSVMQGADQAWIQAAANLMAMAADQAPSSDSGFSPFRFAVQSSHSHREQAPRVFELVVPAGL